MIIVNKNYVIANWTSPNTRLAPPQFFVPVKILRIFPNRSQKNVTNILKYINIIMKMDYLAKQKINYINY